jgi:hypothetical protein
MLCIEDKGLKIMIYASHPGNQNAKKLTTPELCIQAYDQYCAWIASGKSKESWTFKHPDISLTHKTMEKYIRENPGDFPAYKKEEAEADSRRVWEEDGVAMMKGKVRGCQPAIYQMFMRNKFGWDKEKQQSETNEPLARTLLDKLEKSAE